MTIDMYTYILFKENTNHLSFEPVRRVLAKYREMNERTVRSGGNGTLSFYTNGRNKLAGVVFNVSKRQVLLVLENR